MKRVICLIMAAALLIAGLPAYAAGSEQVKIGGNSASVIKIDMSAGVGAALTLGGGSVNKDMPASEHLAAAKKAGGTLIASVNGGLFNSYYNASKTLAYPDNCARTYAVMISGGTPIKGVGETPMLGFTDDGRALIDRVKVSVTVKYRRSDSVSLWGVNDYYTDPNSVVMLTAEMGYPVPLAAGTVLVHIRDGAVAAVEKNAATAAVPQSGESVIVYNQNAWATTEKYFYEPRPGNCAEITTDIAPRRADTASAWSRVTTAVGCGPWLLQSGKDVFSDNADYSDAKFARGAVAARSFAAVMADGSLMLGAATASFDAIIKYLKSLGAVDAMALDGGASSALYSRGETVRAAGRKLSGMLHVIDYGASAPKKPTVKDITTASAWAQPYIALARESALIPEGFDLAAKENITRAEFCQLAYMLLKRWAGDDYSSKIYLTGVSYDDVRAALVDTWDIAVIDCYRLGIVGGVGNKKFDPNGSITREQAAKLLAALAGVIGCAATGESAGYADSASFSAWAAESVDFVTRAGIMNGTSGGMFAPKGFFTKEQAIKTIVYIMDKTL